MPRYVKNDITGEKFGRLTAIKFLPDEGKYAKFLFECECGKKLVILSQSVRSGNTKSCGCLQKEARPITHGHGKRGKKRSPTYSSWASMMDRAKWGGHPSFANYGAKGISVCEEWQKFENFIADMGERPKGTSIDRIDNTKGYAKENCRWATRHEQALNTSRTIKVVIDGELVNVFDLCERLGLSSKAVRSRAFRRGKDYVAALKSFGVDCADRGVVLRDDRIAV